MKTSINKYTRDRLFVFGCIGVGVFVVIAVLSPVIQPYPEDARGRTHVEERLQPPSRQHLFGTEALGRDVFSIVVAGSRISLMVGVITSITALMLGASLGLIAGYMGKWLDEVIMRVTDLFLSFPSLLLAMAVTAALGANLRNAMIAIALTWWPSYCRLARGEMVSVKENTFVESARAIGAGSGRIIFRHLLPNCFTPLFVKLTMDIGLIILTTAGLSFLGLGAQPPTPEWGLLITTGRAQFLTNWWVTTFPGVAILSVVLSFTLMGEGLLEIVDPKRRGRSWKK